MLQAPNRYESYLLNEVLYILVSQEAAKIFEVKVGGHKEKSTKLEPNAPRTGLTVTGFMLDQSTLISYHTEANGSIFFSAAVHIL